jgi:hypothetical protein
MITSHVDGVIPVETLRGLRRYGPKGKAEAQPRVG